MGILTTVMGYLLLTDFQAIPYDPCTEYSPFHHPEITDNFTVSQFSLANGSSAFRPTAESVPKLKGIQFSSSVDIKFGNDVLFHTNLGITNKYLCHQVQECLCNILTPCAYYPTSTNLNTHLKSEQDCYKCTTDESSMTICACFSADQIPQNSPKEFLTLELAELESINVLPKDEYFIARNNCIEANVSGHQCHWTPSSVITNKECEDCQPICRSISQTLTFSQFAIGMGLLIYSSALQLPPIVALLTNQSPKHLQVWNKAAFIGEGEG